MNKTPIYVIIGATALLMVGSFAIYSTTSQTPTSTQATTTETQ